MEDETSSSDLHEGATKSRIIELARVGEAQTTEKKNILFWAFYDAADTVFAMAIVSITLFQWGELMGLRSGFTFARSHLLVSTFLMLSNVVVAILMPILGAHSDLVGKRKPLVIILGVITIAFIPLIVVTMRFLLGLLIFLITNVVFQAANLYYESMLPFICDTNSRAKVSAFGVAFGYVGTIFAILLVFLLPRGFGDATTVDDVLNNNVAIQDIQLGWVYWMFIFAAVFYLFLLIPFFFVKENKSEKQITESFGRRTRSTFVQLGRTFKEIFKENKGMLLFLVGWFLINDAVGTVIAIMVDYLREGLGLEETTAGVILFGGILVGVAFLFIMGPVIDRKGPKFGVVITAIAWIIGIILTVLAGVTYKTVIIGNKTVIYKLRILAYFAAAVLSFGMGSVFVIGRQFILELCPPEKIGQYMGFKKISGKVSAALGPLIFSGVLSLVLPYGKTLAYQIAILSMLVFFLVGFVVILFIKNNHARYLKGERYPYKE
ncbi:MAG: MFS transporter [Candidatus Heimdallarchaeota archaeon]|nr:MFS transporter [Candidatus Heimdallarchaeota archaeon]MBY8993519.1 MFS transporter [Candidatus Heimdallarchaeota archaeon]